MQIREVILKPAEIALVHTVATQRDASKPSGGDVFGKNTAWGQNFKGVFGEYCVRRVYGGKLDLAVRPEGDRHGADIVLPDGRKVEIKTTTFGKIEDAAIYISPDEELHFEWCTLVRLYLPDMAIVFPVWSRQTIVENWKDHPGFGYGPRKAFSPYRLDTSSQAI